MNCDVLGQSSLSNKITYPQIKDQTVNDIKVSPIDKFHLKTYKDKDKDKDTLFQVNITHS